MVVNNKINKVAEEVDFEMAIERVAEEMVGLLKEKNKAYGNSIYTATEIMKLLYPDGINVDQIDEALILVRILDKFSRITKGDKKAFGEDPWRDIVGYSILQSAKNDIKSMEELEEVAEKALR